MIPHSCRTDVGICQPYTPNSLCPWDGFYAFRTSCTSPSFVISHIKEPRSSSALRVWLFVVRVVGKSISGSEHSSQGGCVRTISWLMVSIRGITPTGWMGIRNRSHCLWRWPLTVGIMDNKWSVRLMWVFVVKFIEKPLSPPVGPVVHCPGEFVSDLILKNSSRRVCQ